MSEETEFNTTPLAERTAFNDDFTRQFRANGGQVSEGQLAGIPALLLHTVGAKSGEARTSPLYRLEFAGNAHVVGSFGGSPKAPAWVHNLRANPEVEFEAPGEDGSVAKLRARARELPEAEREQAWAALVREAPFFADYQTKTERVIPLFALVRE